MYDVEKRSNNLENVAGFAKRDVYIHGPVAKWVGVCLYIGETNVAFPQTLYRMYTVRRCTQCRMPLALVS